MIALFYFIIIFLGLTLGSYIFTTVERIDKKKKLLTRSHCNHCKKTLNWFSLIPIVGFVLQRGRCRFCKKSISFHSTVFEVINALFVLVIVAKVHNFEEMLFYIIMWEILFFTAYLDLKTEYIYSIPVVLLFVAITIYVLLYQQSSIMEHILGLLLATGFLHWFKFLYETIRNKEALGDGDSILFGAICFITGWKSIFPIIIYSSLIGVFFGILYLFLSKKKITQSIPFAPALFLGGFLAWYFPSLFHLFFPFYQTLIN